jgi:hypothetical protein
MDLPDYFDSQAQAAAMLGMSIYDIKAAKARGCPAFRGGRIRRKEFLDWLNEPEDSDTDDDDDDAPYVSVWADWDSKTRRRQMLFCLIEFLEKALKQEQITAEEFCEIGKKTIPLIVELCGIWNVKTTEKQRARLQRNLTRAQQKLLQKAGTSTPEDNGTGAS